MGKYESVIGDLKKLPFDLREGGSEYQFRVNLAKGQIEDRTPVGLSRAWILLRAQEDQLEAQAKKLRVQLRAYEQLIEEAFEANGIKKLSLDEGNVSTQPEPYTYIADKPVYHSWCIEQGLLPLMSLPWQTTNSMAKERLVAGQDLPPGLDIFAKTKFVLRG